MPSPVACAFAGGDGSYMALGPSRVPGLPGAISRLPLLTAKLLNGVQH
jgi:hypothetical protein